MRRINNSSPPFQLLLLCTASTGEEMRFFSPLSPTHFTTKFTRQSLLGQQLAPGLLHADTMSERLTSRPARVALVACSGCIELNTHTHTRAHKQKKKQKNDPAIRAHTLQTRISKDQPERSVHTSEPLQNCSFGLLVYHQSSPFTPPQSITQACFCPSFLRDLSNWADIGRGRCSPDCNRSAYCSYLLLPRSHLLVAFREADVDASHTVRSLSPSIWKFRVKVRNRAI